MVKESTIKKYKILLQEILDSGLSINKYFESKGKSTSSFYATMANIKKDAQNGIAELQELLNLYDKVKKSSNYKEIESTIESNEGDQGIELNYIRDTNNKIQKYEVIVPVKDSVPFHTILTREEAETIFGLYTYYGGNISARNVTNEFPKYTLPEIKKIFRAFGLYKDSIWAPRHLVEELSVEQLSDYRMHLKEKAAFKYADAQQERDFKNNINKLAKQINSLNDRNEFINNLISQGFGFKEYPVSTLNTTTKTGVIVLSDLHVGAYNTPNGYLPLLDYNKQEIEKRLDKIISFIQTKANDWDELVVLNLGDSIDNYRGTTAKGTPLPTNMSEKESAQMYIGLMLNWFNKLTCIYNKPIAYVCTGDSNHGASYDWLANVALVPYLNNLEVDCYVSDDPIDSFNVNNFTITYLHGHDSRTQYKGMPLNLDEKTKNWFNNYFLQAKFDFKPNKIVIKGDLHQYNVNSCNTFDYINAPSLYGSSSYIVSNFGKGKEGTLYLEIGEDNYVSGVIWN